MKKQVFRPNTVISPLQASEIMRVNRKGFHSLKIKLVLIILAISLIPLLVLSLYQVNSLRLAVSKSITSDEMTKASDGVETMNTWIDSKISELSAFAVNHTEMANAGSEKIIDKLKSISEIDTDILGNAVTDREGNYINDEKMTGNIAGQPYFQEVQSTGEGVVSDIIQSETFGGNEVVIAYPMKDSADNFKGIISSKISISSLKKLLGTLQDEENGYDSCLLSGTGIVIYLPDPSALGKEYTEVIKSESQLTAIKDKIMADKSGMVEYTDDDGIKKVAAFDTVDKTGWKLIVAAPSGELYRNLNQTVFISVLIIAVAVIFILIISIIMSRIIAIPIIKTVNSLKVMANADFTQKVPDKFLKRKDEIGILARSMELMGQSVREVIHSVIEEVKTVKNNIVCSSEELNQLVSQAGEVSSTTEEMAAGTEETAASTEEMNAASGEIENAVRTMAEKAQNGLLIADEISKRAQTLKDSAVASQETAYETYNSIDSDIRKSIEQSRAVEQIDVLLDAILQITAQTNLLALNASIEAARAGDAGRGFAVVAEEIGKLADNSKNTINEIQNIAKLVVSSVENLSQNAEKALRYIHTTVIDDYKMMVDIGERYYKDSDSVQKLVTDFGAMAETLLMSMHSMVKAISEITETNSENAMGTQIIAERASNVMSKAAEVGNLFEQTEESSEKLMGTVSKFKI